MKLLSSNIVISTDLSKLVIPDECDVEQTLINSELIKWITTLTYDLSPKQRMVFTLRDIEGLELDEICKITGMSSAKIKSNLYLAREYIRKKLKDEIQ